MNRVWAFIRERINSFGPALSGWAYVLRSQQNAWLHAVASVLAFTLGAWLQISRVEWALIIVAVAFVWAAEFLNTALEAVVDLASPDKHPLAKVGKDIGAAAVLISALNAVVIGLLVLGPPLWARISPLL
jgi:diacylglycerol kinase